MKISYRWLNELVAIPWTPDELPEKLAQLGFPVESMMATGVRVQQVIAVKILGVSKHPNADRLQVAQVTDGKTERSIVCGAPNIAPGQIVPLALPGAKLPGGLSIAVTTIRGVQSHGMLCSERELGLSENHAGILQLPPNAKLGSDVKNLFGGEDTVYDIEVTPNRPDALSHVGIARELAALSVKSLKPFKYAVSKSAAGEKCQIKNEEPALCQRYLGRLFHHVKVGPSPVWMSERLKACGIRSINNIVDITNYVLLEWGHPLHAFDLDKLSGRRIVVRRAKTGEKILALDEKTYELSPSDLVIADGDRPVAVAGVMGGQETGVTNSTQSILLESAVFDRVSVRLTSRRLDLKSESSLRFEKGADPITAESAWLRATQLIKELAEGEIGQMTDVYPKRFKPSFVSLQESNLSRLVGRSLDAKKVSQILARLDFNPK